MNTLLSIVRDVALLVMISAFWEMLVPAGKLRATVRLVIGLLLIATVIMPVAEALTRHPEPWLAELPAADTGDTDATLAQGEQIAGQMEDAARRQYEEDLARQVVSLVLLQEEIASAVARVSSDEQGGIAQVYVEAVLSAGAGAAAAEEKTRNVLGAFFALEAQQITCKMQEVAEDE